jgi:hypothetical protein
MNNLMKYDEFLNEEMDFNFLLFFLGFIIGIVVVPSVLGRITGNYARQYGIFRPIKIFINKMKAVKSYRRQATEILNDLTDDQKKKLKTYIKHSALAKWSSEERFFGVIPNPPVINIGENDPLGEEDWGDQNQNRQPVEIGRKYHKNAIRKIDFIGNNTFNGVAATGSEEEFIKDARIEREKEEFLNIFNDEQRLKVEKLIDIIDYEFQEQTTRGSTAWGVKEPGVEMDIRPELNLRPLDLNHEDDMWLHDVRRPRWSEDYHRKGGRKQ